MAEPRHPAPSPSPDGPPALRISVVIPALNEAATLPATLDALRAHALEVEVIVADAGSTDGTRRVVREHPARPRLVAAGPRLGAPCHDYDGVRASPYSWNGALTRGATLNAGAAAASGDVLWFLHADTAPGPGQAARVTEALRDARVVGGAFEFGLRGRGWPLRVVEAINRVRYRIRSRFYGDQGIFVRRAAFQRLGGFAEYGLLEDAHFCRDLRRLGRLSLVRSVLPTSARRFRRGGVFHVLARDIRIWWLDLVGGDTQRFAAPYRAENLRPHGGPEGKPGGQRGGTARRECVRERR